MSKENILFSVIGVLLGFIVGFMFANTVNRRGETSRAIAPPGLTTAQPVGGANGQTPPGHTGLPSNAVAEQNGTMGGQPPEIQAMIERARANTDDFEAQVQAADLFYRVRRFDEAIAFLQRANTLRPDNYEVIVKLGNVNFDAGRYETAERWYALALTKNTDDVNVRTDLGLTFLAREPSDVDRAVAEFRRSLARDPRHEATLQNLTVALTRKGDFDGAQTTLAQLQSVNPNNTSIPNLRTRLEQRRAN